MTLLNRLLLFDLCWSLLLRLDGLLFDSFLNLGRWFLLDDIWRLHFRLFASASSSNCRQWFLLATSISRSKIAGDVHWGQSRFTSRNSSFRLRFNLLFWGKLGYLFFILGLAIFLLCLFFCRFVLQSLYHSLFLCFFLRHLHYLSKCLFLL